MPTKTSRRTFKSRTRKPARKAASRWSGKKTTARATRKARRTATTKARRSAATKARRSAWKATKTWKIGSWSRSARRAA